MATRGGIFRSWRAPTTSQDPTLNTLTLIRLKNGAANLLALASLNVAAGRRGGGRSNLFVAVAENVASGRRGGGASTLYAPVTQQPQGGSRKGGLSRLLASTAISSRGDKRIASIARFMNLIRSSSVGARVPPIIVEPAGKSIMRNKIRVLDNDRYSSRGVQFDGDNSFTVKLTQNEAGRLEIYYDHLLEAGDYVVSCVATISGETPPVISLNVAGTIATMIVSGGGFDREMTIVATTFFGLADEIKLCIRDYVRPRARPRDY